jgi:hypothetical protein
MKWALIPALLAISLVPAAMAFEANDTVFLDDSEYVSILIETDSNGNASFVELFITPDSGDQYFMDETSADRVRIADDHSHGTIYGTTDTGDRAYVIFEVDGEDVKLKAKIWTSNGVERMVSNGEIFSLF